MSGNIDDTRETVNIFPSVIQLSTLLGASSMKRDLIRSVEKIRKTTPNGRPDAWTSSVYTTLVTHDKLHKEAEFKGLTDHILREAEHFAGTLGIDLEHFRLVYKDCWFNIYGWKDGQEIHIHNNSVISGSYYLKIPDGASGLICSGVRGDIPPQSLIPESTKDFRYPVFRLGGLWMFISGPKRIRATATVQEVS